MKYLITAILLLALSVGCASAKVNIVATTNDMADVAKAIGGNRVNVVSLVAGTQDPHVIEPRPSQVVHLRRADMIIRVGMDLDLWADALIDASRNSKIARGSRGYVDASRRVRKLEVPTGRVDGSMGDVHAFGNPHYHLDPLNMKIVAQDVLAAMKRVSPNDADFFQRNHDAFAARIDRMIPEWRSRMAPLRGRKIVTYHKNWSYLFNRFGISLFDTIEPKPGISPSPAHVRGLVNRMKRDNVNSVMVASYFPRRFPDMIARETNAKVVALPMSVGAVRGADDYFKLMDIITRTMSEGLR